MAELVIDQLAVTYETAQNSALLACEGFDLAVEPGEFVTIIGPSGCGKSTVLHAMGGLLQPSAGSVTFDGVPMDKPDPRKAAFVFQDYSLMPWKTVLDNVALGLQFAGVGKKEARERAANQLAFVGLGDFASAYPAALSGGMQQRVAVARAIVMEPEILLMDEPFGALDEQSRRQLGLEMAKLLTGTGRSVVLITHSLDEAIYWGDRIVVMSQRPGRIIEEIRVTEQRPRELDFMMTQEFQDIRLRLFELIQLHGHVATSGSEAM